MIYADTAHAPLFEFPSFLLQTNLLLVVLVCRFLLGLFLKVLEYLQQNDNVLVYGGKAQHRGRGGGANKEETEKGAGLVGVEGWNLDPVRIERI